MQAVQMIVEPSKGSLMETLLRLGPGERDVQPLPSAVMIVEPSKGSLMETLLRLGPGERDAQPLP